MNKNNRKTSLEYVHLKNKFKVTWWDNSESYFDKIEDALESINTDFRRFLRK